MFKMFPFMWNPQVDLILTDLSSSCTVLLGIHSKQFFPDSLLFFWPFPFRGHLLLVIDNRKGVTWQTMGTTQPHTRTSKHRKVFFFATALRFLFRNYLHPGKTQWNLSLSKKARLERPVIISSGSSTASQWCLRVWFGAGGCAARKKKQKND